MTEINRRKQSRIIEHRETSLGGGINVGRYPFHEFSFSFLNDPLYDWPLLIHFAGNDYWKKGCYRYRKNSDTFALELVTDGVFDFTQNGASYEVHPGEMFLVQLGMDSEISCDSVKLARKSTVSITGPLLPSVLSSTGLAGVSVIQLRNPEKFQGYIDRAAQLLREKPGEFARLSSVLAYEILLELSTEQSGKDFPEQLEQIVDFLVRNLQESITVNDLCQRFNLSSTSIFRLFQKHLHTSVIEFLIRRRMEVAAELLEITELPVKEISFRVGYRNPLYFSGEFRRFYHCAPREFRRNRRNSDAKTGEKPSVQA